jgi:hypothetical protein
MINLVYYSVVQRLGTGARKRDHVFFFFYTNKKVALHNVALVNKDTYRFFGKKNVQFYTFYL